MPKPRFQYPLILSGYLKFLRVSTNTKIIDSSVYKDRHPSNINELVLGVGLNNTWSYFDSQRNTQQPDMNPFLILI